MYINMSSSITSTTNVGFITTIGYQKWASLLGKPTWSNVGTNIVHQMLQYNIELPVSAQSTNNWLYSLASHSIKQEYIERLKSIRVWGILEKQSRIINVTSMALREKESDQFSYGINSNAPYIVRHYNLHPIQFIKYHKLT